MKRKEFEGLIQAWKYRVILLVVILAFGSILHAQPGLSDQHRLGSNSHLQKDESKVLSQEFFSPALERHLSFMVYLPGGYESGGKDFSILYLLHGNGGNCRDWLELGGIRKTADALIASGTIPPCVIVMPDADSSWYVDLKEKIETAILTELIPEVERRFRVSRQRSHRFVAGLSMGGYGAMRFSLIHPELFGAAALLSPAIYDPEPPLHSGVRKGGVFGSAGFDARFWKACNYPSLWKAYRGKNLPVPMFIVSGDDDEYGIESQAARFYSFLRKRGQPAELRIIDGGHSWNVWKAAIGDALKYLFSQH